MLSSFRVVVGGNSCRGALWRLRAWHELLEPLPPYTDLFLAWHSVRECCHAGLQARAQQGSSNSAQASWRTLQSRKECRKRSNGMDLGSFLQYVPVVLLNCNAGTVLEVDKRVCRRQEVQTHGGKCAEGISQCIHTYGVWSYVGWGYGSLCCLLPGDEKKENAYLAGQWSTVPVGLAEQLLAEVRVGRMLPAVDSALTASTVDCQGSGRRNLQPSRSLLGMLEPAVGGLRQGHGRLDRACHLKGRKMTWQPCQTEVPAA